MSTIEILLGLIVLSFGLLSSMTLGLTGWTLLEVVRLGKNMAAMSQKVRDLPCVNNGTKCKKAE